MGLDSYVTAERHLWDFGDSNDGEKIEAIGKLFPEMTGFKVQQVEVELMYWRKANAIHRWFVDNVQEGVDECQKSWVTVEQLYALRDTCNAVLADRTQAETLLPAQKGFFFGGTEYDESYFDDVERTLAWLDKLLFKDTFDAKVKSWSFFYQASW